MLIAVSSHINGNQTSRTIAGMVYTLTYDYENRLVAVSGGSISASFVYDASGNRVKGTINSVTTVCLYSWRLRIPERRHHALL